MSAFPPSIFDCILSVLHKNSAFAASMD